MTFQIGETVICSVTVRDTDGVLADPSTSMKITITDSQKSIKVNNQDMPNDSKGEYHYDFDTSSLSLTGIYTVIYKATDGSRVSIKEDSVELI